MRVMGLAPGKQSMTGNEVMPKKQVVDMAISFFTESP